MEAIKYILSSIIVVATPLIFTKILFNCRLRKDKNRIIVMNLVALISSILIYMNTCGMYRSSLMVIVYVALIKQTYNISLRNTIIAVVILVILLIIFEIVLPYVMINILKLSRDYCYNVFAGSLFSNVVVCLSVIIISLIIKKLILKLINIQGNYNLKIIIFAVLSLFSILIFFYDTTANFKIGSRVIFYVIAIFTFICALIIVINQENKNLKLKTEYEKLLDFMQIYEEEIEKERIIKHEYKNQLITIKSKIIDNDNENKIIDYINNVIEDESSFAQEEYTKFQYLPPNGLKALLYFKVASAKSKNINVSVNISPSIKDSFLNNLTTQEFKDLGMLIGIYIDNAIEASEKSKDKIMGIEIYNDENEINIIISNSYAGQIDENKIGKVHFSTKGEKRGYGLLLAKKIIKDNKQFDTITEIKNNLYIQTVTLKDKYESST